MDINYSELSYDSIFQIGNEFIIYSIEQGIQASLGEREYFVGDLKKMYFVGATLFLDTRDEFGESKVITLCHSDETFGDFQGGIRRLLSIDALKKLEKLLELCEINHTPKWNY